MKRRSKKAGIDTAIEFFARARPALDVGHFPDIGRDACPDVTDS
jgi:hypothetical protein